MINVDLIRKILHERISYESGDPIIMECRDRMTELLVVDETVAVDFLNQCSETEVYYLCEIFEDMSEKLQSRSFVESLKVLQSKFPNVDMSVDIKYAEIVLKNK